MILRLIFGINSYDRHYKLAQKFQKK